MPSSVCWHVDVLRTEYSHLVREVSHILRKQYIEIGGQRKKGGLKRTLKKQVEKERMKVGLIREGALCRGKKS